MCRGATQDAVSVNLAFTSGAGEHSLHTVLPPSLPHTQRCNGTRGDDPAVSAARIGGTPEFRAGLDTHVQNYCPNSRTQIFQYGRPCRFHPNSQLGHLSPDVWMTTTHFACFARLQNESAWVAMVWRCFLVSGRCNETIRHETRRHGARACADGQAGLTAGSLPLTSCFPISTHTLDIS